MDSIRQSLKFIRWVGERAGSLKIGKGIVAGASVAL